MKNAKCSIASIRKKAIPVLKRHAVKRASIFGSFARGTAKSRSDVDFLIEYKKRIRAFLI
jgi:predicted nucleotidyltransferase